MAVQEASPAVLPGVLTGVIRAVPPRMSRVPAILPALKDSPKQIRLTTSISGYERER